MVLVLSYSTRPVGQGSGGVHHWVLFPAGKIDGNGWEYVDYRR